MSTKVHEAAWKSIAEERQREIKQLRAALSVAVTALQVGLDNGLCEPGSNTYWIMSNAIKMTRLIGFDETSVR